METKTNITNLPAIAVPGLPVSAPKLERVLLPAIKSSVRVKFVTDAQLDENPNAHATFHSSWDIPHPITRAIIDAAKAALPLWDAYMVRAPIGHIGSPNTVAEWLSQLGVLCASQKMSVADAKEKLVAYATGLDFPTECFTQKSLYVAARHFKWFPTFSEVCDWLEKYIATARVMHDRIRALANADLTPTALAAPVKGPFIKDMPEAQRDEYIAQMKGLKSRLEAAGVGNTERAAQARRDIDTRNERARALLAPVLEAKRKALLGDDDGTQD